MQAKYESCLPKDNAGIHVFFQSRFIYLLGVIKDSIRHIKNTISTLDFVLEQHAATFVGMCNDEESKKWLLSLATLSLIDTPDQY